MAEYLKRDDVLSDADILTVQTREYGTIDVVPVEYIADLPIADVMEVIRCKGCKYWIGVDYMTVVVLKTDFLHNMQKIFVVMEKGGIYNDRS